MSVQELFHEDNITNFAFPEVDDKSVNIIKVIGVGGGGGNAVKNMAMQGVKNVSFAVVNTDTQALSNSNIETKVAIGKTGLGVGGNPSLGKEAAEFSVENIKHLFDANTKMVFITAGMGGGTGTGAAPVIARVAREMDILTVGVVTIPFQFEKSLRIEKALRGVQELKNNVDSLLVINNQRLLEIYADGMTTVEEAFQKADDVLTVATKSVAEIITVEGKVNRDFCDVRTVMKNGGGTIVSVGRASGENRILKAMVEALNSPLFNKVEIEKAQRLLYVIYQSHDNPVKINEVSEINMFMDKLANDLEVLWGLYWDDTLGDDVKVTIIATGFDRERQSETKDERDEKVEVMKKWYYESSEEPAAASSEVDDPEETSLPDSSSQNDGEECEESNNDECDEGRVLNGQEEDDNEEESEVGWFGKLMMKLNSLVEE